MLAEAISEVGKQDAGEPLVAKSPRRTKALLAAFDRCAVLSLYECKSSQVAQRRRFIDSISSRARPSQFLTEVGFGRAVLASL